MAQWLRVTERETEFDTLINLDRVDTIHVEDATMVLTLADSVITIKNNSTCPLCEDVDEMLLSLKANGNYIVFASKVEISFG